MRSIILIILFVSFHTGYAQSLSSPAIKDYGKIWDLEDVKRPDATKEYKIFIDLKASSSRNAKTLNRGLDNVARMLNLHVTGGVPLENIKVAVAVHGGATPLVMNNEGFNEKFKTDNPNLDLISQLKDAGVEIYVCGQSLLARGYDRKFVSEDVEVALSMLTVATEKMAEGYGILVFQ